MYWSQQPKRSISFDLLKENLMNNNVTSRQQQQQLSPPTPFADDATTAASASSTMAKASMTLPRPPSRTTSRGASLKSTSQHQQRPLSLAVTDSGKTSLASDDTRRQCRTLPRNCCRAIPPPPQYKGVHFAPGVEQQTGPDRSTTPPLVIPTEGLPTGPAR